MARSRKAGGIRIQLIVLGTTGLLALVMAVVMAVHKPFISKVPVQEAPTPVMREDREVARPRAVGPASDHCGFEDGLVVLVNVSSVTDVNDVRLLFFQNPFQGDNDALNAFVKPLVG